MCQLVIVDWLVGYCIIGWTDGGFWLILLLSLDILAGVLFGWWRDIHTHARILFGDGAVPVTFPTTLPAPYYTHIPPPHHHLCTFWFFFCHHHTYHHTTTAHFTLLPRSLRCPFPVICAVTLPPHLTFTYLCLYYTACHTHHYHCTPHTHTTLHTHTTTHTHHTHHLHAHTTHTLPTTTTTTLPHGSLLPSYLNREEKRREEEKDVRLRFWVV